MGKLTPTESKAIQQYIGGSNYRLMLNNKPGFVNFQDKVTGETSSRSLASLVSEYKQAQKGATKQRNADKAKTNQADKNSKSSQTRGI